MVARLWIPVNRPVSDFMTGVETLQFESALTLQSLFGNDLGLLKILEQELGVRLTTREGWLRVERSDEAVDQVRRLFAQLEKARQNGVPIRRAAVIPKTENQRTYVQAIQEPEEMQRCLERNVIEIAPVAYMRGLTLAGSFIVLDEAQNTTPEQMLMFLTRLGLDSNCVITGDQRQIDLPSNRRSGLVEALQALRGVPGIGFCHFGDKDVVRHKLVAFIVSAYRRHRGAGEPSEVR